MMTDATSAFMQMIDFKAEVELSTTCVGVNQSLYSPLILLPTGVLNDLFLQISVLMATAPS